MLMPLRRWLRTLARGKRCKTRSTKSAQRESKYNYARREAPTVRSFLWERERESPGGRLPLVRNNLTEPRSRALEPPLPRRGTSQRRPKGRRRARSLRPVKGAGVLYMRVYRSRSKAAWLAGWYYLIAVLSARCPPRICILDGRCSAGRSLRSLP